MPSLASSAAASAAVATASAGTGSSGSISTRKIRSLKPLAPSNRASSAVQTPASIPIPRLVSRSASSSMPGSFMLIEA